jgi:large subunit ribosomal protein L31
MKEKIHPAYYHDAVITCGCGHEFTTGSTQKKMHVEVCSNCHPLYTGTQKVLDSQGRVDRFKKIREKTTAKAKDRLAKKAKVKK